MRRDRDDSPPKSSKFRWRQRNIEEYSRNKRKTRRNLGQNYKSDSTNKIIEAREIGPPCTCKNKCREKLEECYTEIFQTFWDLGSYNLQNSYLYGCIQVQPKKRSYRKKQKKQESSRKCTARYMVNVNGRNTKICKTEFINVHGLQLSKGRINRLVSKKNRRSSSFEYRSKRETPKQSKTTE